MEHHPEFLQKLQREGKLQPYLDGIQREYCRKADALTEQYSEEMGLRPEDAEVDFVHALLGAYHVQQRVRDTLLPELRREKGAGA